MLSILYHIPISSKTYTLLTVQGVRYKSFDHITYYVYLNFKTKILLSWPDNSYVTVEPIPTSLMCQLLDYVLTV